MELHIASYALLDREVLGLTVLMNVNSSPSASGLISVEGSVEEGILPLHKSSSCRPTTIKRARALVCT